MRAGRLRAARLGDAFARRAHCANDNHLLLYRHVYHQLRRVLDALRGAHAGASEPGAQGEAARQPDGNGRPGGGMPACAPRCAGGAHARRAGSALVNLPRRAARESGCASGLGRRRRGEHGRRSSRPACGGLGGGGRAAARGARQSHAARDAGGATCAQRRVRRRLRQCHISCNNTPATADRRRHAGGEHAAAPAELLPHRPPHTQKRAQERL